MLPFVGFTTPGLDCTAYLIASLPVHSLLPVVSDCRRAAVEEIQTVIWEVRTAAFIWCRSFVAVIATSLFMF